MYAYTPGRLVKAILNKIGFEVIQNVDYEDINVSWIEARKPGKLTSMRGGQELSKIIRTTADRI